MLQEQYWKELFQLKAHIAFVEILLEESENTDRKLKIVIAVASSSSIGAWAIWHTLSWLWAAIIAVSQVISAINQYLPYKSRMKTYSSLLVELEELMIKSESQWHAIAEGQLSATEINQARFDMRSAKQKSLNKHISTTIPTDEKVQAKAEKQAASYFSTFYPTREEV